jgi:putative flippase GtrA
MKISKELLGYGILGLFITLLYGVVLSAFVELVKLAPIYANAITFVLMNLLSYFLQSRFVFRRAFHFHDYFRFFTSYLLSYVMTLVIVGIAEWVGIHYLVGYMLTVTVIPICSFSLLKRWVFR